MGEAEGRIMPMARRSALVFVPVAVLLVRSPAPAQQPVPYFELGPCPVTQAAVTPGRRVECGALIVAQNRADPNGKRLRIAVAILRSSGPSTETPLVILHGGPSGPGGIRAGSMALAVRWSSALDRDIIVYDQRGAGFSEPALCPEVAVQSIDVRNTLSEAERESGYGAVAAMCVASLRREGIDPIFFNSVTNAADLTDLRSVLGYEQWDVLGVSYGSRLAQEAMRRDAQGIRSAVLVSPLIPGLKRTENPISYQRVLARLFAECAAQPSCSAVFPSPGEDLDRLYAQLDSAPMEVVVERDGTSSTVLVDGRRLLAEIFGRYSTTEMDRLPLLLHELTRGDRDTAARLLVRSGTGTNAINNVLTNLVGCYDHAGTVEYRRAAEDLRGSLDPRFRPFLTDGAVCRSYMDEFAPAEDLELVRSDIPTLILTQQFDDRTPTEHGREIAAALEHAYLFELPGLAHAETPPGCTDSLVLAFLRDPTREPEASCIDEMPRLTFETGRLERPMLFFAITSPDSIVSPFAGAWDAAFPNAPRPFDFTLTISGNEVTGSISAGNGALNLPIFDGAVDGRMMTFKVIGPDGGRTVTFSGTLEDDQISFVRDVSVDAGREPGGAGLWGVLGAPSFTAHRQ
jgi:pimeloyl-ACP methyl ester carboxylesterase